MSAVSRSAPDERRAVVTLVGRLLDAHAQLVGAAAVARVHGLTRCAESLTRQHAAVSSEISGLVADLAYPTTALLESVA